MGRSICWSIFVIFAFVALETAKTASCASSNLPSPSMPIYASYADQTYAVVQNDGFITFEGASSSFSCLIPSSLRGEAYHVYNAKSSYVDVAVANASALFVIRCSKSTQNCSSRTAPYMLPLPATSKKVLSIRSLSDDSSVIVIATSNAIVTWNLSSMKKISNVTWAFDNSYPLNFVSGLRLSGSGPYYLMVALADSMNPSNPGVVVKIGCDSNGHLSSHPPIITYMTIGPMNFVVSESYPDVRYWSQTNIPKGYGYVNAYTHTSWPPAKTTLTSGQVISPSFVGEYPMTQVGIMAVGKPDTLGYDLLCLHFGYGMSSGPEVSITKRYRGSNSMGMPILGFQVDGLSANIIAVSRTTSGWKIVSIYFGGCPMESFAKQQLHHQKQQIHHQKQQQQQQQTSNEQENQKQQQQTSNEQENQKQFTRYEKGFSHLLPKIFAGEGCRLSSCSIDVIGDCTPQKCWSDALTGRFMCCKHPPV